MAKRIVVAVLAVFALGACSSAALADRTEYNVPISWVECHTLSESPIWILLEYLPDSGKFIRAGMNYSGQPNMKLPGERTQFAVTDEDAYLRYFDKSQGKDSLVLSVKEEDGTVTIHNGDINMDKQPVKCCRNRE
ncbi:MAG: hypothetical protein PHP45_09780 [Elusimicrobiales bacterium]|nr:hypothetical protein [Elusimicrobiales bacterium]